MVSSLVSVIEASSMRRDQRLSQPSGCINALGYSTTGGLLAAAGDDMGVHIWAAGMQHQYRCRLETCHGGNVFGVEFAPGREDLVATCAADSTINLLTLERPHCATVRQISCHSNMVNSICFPFSSPAILYSVGADGKIFVSDLRCAASSTASSLVVDFKCSLTDVDASPQHGNLLAVAGRHPTAFIVDLRLATAGHSAASRSAASAPAAGASHDLPRCCVAELWCGFETGASESSTTNRLALQPAMLRAHTTGVRWSPDGAFVAACSIKGGVRVFADPTTSGLGLHHPDASHGHLLEVPWSAARPPEQLPTEQLHAETTTITHSEPAISPAWLQASRQDMINYLSLGGHELGTDVPGMRLAQDLAPGYYRAPPTPSDGASAAGGSLLPARSRRPMPQFSRIGRRGLMAWNIEFLQRQMGSAQARYDSSTGRALRARRAASRWGRGASSGGRPASACVLGSGALHSRTKKGLEWVGGRSGAVAMGSSTGHVFIWDIQGALQRNMADRQAAHRRDVETMAAGSSGSPVDSHDGALEASSVPGVSDGGGGGGGDGGAAGGWSAGAGADADRGNGDDSRPEAVMFAAASRLGLQDAERECGRARLIGCFRADRTIANVVRARPGSRGLELAVSGLDHAVGVWSPGQRKWPPINRSLGFSQHSRPRGALASGRVPRRGGALQPSLVSRLARAGRGMLEVDRPVAAAHHCATFLAEGMHALSRVAKRLAQSSVRARASESTQTGNGAGADPGSPWNARDGEAGPSCSHKDADGSLELVDGSIDWGSAKEEASEILRLAVALEARQSPRKRPGCQSVATAPASTDRPATSELSSQPSAHCHPGVSPSGDSACALEEHLSSLGRRSYRLATQLVELTADAGDGPAHPEAPKQKTAIVSSRQCSVQGDSGHDEVAGMLGQDVRYESLTAREVFLLCWSSERRNRGMPQLTDGMDEDVVGWAWDQARREREAREADREDGLSRGLVRRFLQNARQRRRGAEGVQDGFDAGAARPVGSGVDARVAHEVDAAGPGTGAGGPDEAEPPFSREEAATGSQPQLSQEQMVEVVRMRLVQQLMLRRRRRARRTEASRSTGDNSGSSAAPQLGSGDGTEGGDGPEGSDGNGGADSSSPDDNEHERGVGR